MKFKLIFAVSVIVAATFSCEKVKKSETNEKKSDTETTEIDNLESGQIAVESNPLAISYPEGLTVSTLNSDATEELEIQAQTATVGTVAISYSDNAATGLTLTTQGPGDQGIQMQGSGPGNCPVSYDDVANSSLTNKAKIAANRKLIIERAEQYAKDQTARSKAADTLAALKGKECVTPTLKRSLRRLVTINKSSMNADGWGNCYLPDFGIVEGKFPGSEDVCMIGNSRFELGEISTLVDMALAFDQAMLCQAKKDALENELDVGESRDLTNSLRKALEDPEVKSRANVASAKLALSGSDTSKIYTTDLVINVLMRNESSTPITFKLVHKPADETNSSYSGTMTIVYLDQRPVTEKEATRALSLSYSKAAEKVGEIETSRIKYDLRTSTYAKDKVKFNADGLLEFNTGGCGVETDAFAPMQLVTYDGYPELDVAKMASWTNFGKNYEEAARGFVFDVRRENGVAKGCAIAGSAGYMLPGDYNGDATPVGSFSIRKALASDLTLSPLGYWQPMLCREDTGTNPSTGRYGNKVWQQCFKKNETGSWVIDTEKTTGATGFDFVDIAAVDQGLLSLPRDPGYKPDRKSITTSLNTKCGPKP